MSRDRGHFVADYAPSQPVSERDRKLADKAYALFRKYADALAWSRAKIQENERRILPVPSLYAVIRQQSAGKQCPSMGYMEGGVDPLDMGTKTGTTNTATPVLQSVCESLTADLSLDVPEPVLLGRGENDQPLAYKLTQFLRAERQMSDYKQLHRKLCRDAVVRGWAVQKVIWDTDADWGKGGVRALYVDGCAFVPDPYCEDIQDGKACFHVSYFDRDWYAEHYPDKYKEMTGGCDDLTDFESPGQLGIPADTTDRVGMLEYWYKKYNADTRKTSVHMAKIAGGAVLECSEDDHPEGIYAHGLYPFVLRTLIPIPGLPFGLGIPDIYAPMQEFIDLCDMATLKSMLIAMNPRLLVNGQAAGGDIETLLDWHNQAVVLQNGSSGPLSEVAQWMQPAPFNSLNVQQAQQKTDMIKDLSGQNAFTRGEGGGGVTAASAILALQDAGNKRSRAYMQGFFASETDAVNQQLELIREFYTGQRVMRVTDHTNGAPNEFAVYENADQARMQGSTFGVDEGGEDFKADGYPVQFDVQIHVNKGSELSLLSHNELMMQLFSMMANMGVPVNGLDLLKSMTFDGQETVLKTVSESLSQQLMEMQQTMQAQQVEIENLSAAVASAEEQASGNRPSAQASAEMPSGNTGTPRKITPAETAPRNLPGQQRVSPRQVQTRIANQG